MKLQDYRVQRSGSWRSSCRSSAEFYRAASRFYDAPEFRYSVVGFRPSY